MAKSTVKGTKIKLDRSDIIIRTIGYVVVTLYALACVLPFLIIIGTSFTAEEVIIQKEHSCSRSSLQQRLMRW